jgi:hypothetical protein
MIENVCNSRTSVSGGPIKRRLKIGERPFSRYSAGNRRRNCLEEAFLIAVNIAKLPSEAG